MHSPALALSWQLWGRHRVGLVVVAISLITVAAIFRGVHALPGGDLEMQHGFSCSILFLFALIYVAGVFAFGFESRLEVRESGFPAHMFLLPVRTALLVAWPMLQGMAAVVVLAVTWTSFVLRPSGIEVPLPLIACVAAAFVGVLQALLWCPFGLPWARVVTAILALLTLVVAPLIAALYGVSNTALMLSFAALLPVAYATAVAGVARARRGDVPDWQRRFEPFARALSTQKHRSNAFRRPEHALFWFECRQHLVGFPLVVGCFAALHLGFAFWLTHMEGHRLEHGTSFLLFPLMLAPIVGCFLGRCSTSAGNPYPLSSLIATRPITTAAIVVAKLKTAALVTVMAWGVVVLLAACWLVPTGMYSSPPTWLENLVQNEPAWKVAVMGLLLVGGLLVITWKLLIDNLVYGLAGRPWLLRGSLLIRSVAVTGGFMLLGHFSGQPGFAETFRAALPWWAAGLVALKLVLAAWAFVWLLRRGTVAPGTLVRILAIWVLLAANVFGLVHVVIPASADRLLLACGVILCLPLAHVAWAPLALDWNRHG
jgi:hypothetical protein